MSDLISRQAAIENIKECAQAAHSNYEWDMEQGYINAIECLEELPSAQPEIIHCKDCKYWKDSDGVYRRGFDAESKCPLNLKEVYDGTFYCGMAERRTDE